MNRAPGTGNQAPGTETPGPGGPNSLARPHWAFIREDPYSVPLIGEKVCATERRGEGRDPLGKKEGHHLSIGGHKFF